ncbi:hypothetical protein JGH11_15240 [Dysgonomonas sp. Marseille-P4677]|uniref:hypothetical protein n=1 Tax=Dysgonomonas sp. Marseille-P4677 TaxID=2364790 RepID=UPI0019138637|nr:hypothetical protein [Dysgonomonas sp. Marseille-P4677]MBK5722229.1 hypothetical protein [Dysgonomonas sp. Marseille-P4677]
MVDFDEIKSFEVSDFDTSSLIEKYVVCYRGRYFEVNKAVTGLIELMKNCSSKEEVRLRFSSERGMDITEEQMDKVINKCITPIIESHKAPQPKPFLVKFELVSAKMVSVVSKVLKYLINPRIALLLIVIILTLHTFFYTTMTDLAFDLSELSVLGMLSTLLIFILSSCFHELGHAAACQYFGIGHGGVGFGLYLNFPVFYTDVSNVWKLSRNKRLVVNMAGVYFQLIFLIPFIIYYFLTSDPIVKYLIITVNFNFLITLNPFFKFDGYWMVSDILGVPSLRLRTQEVFKYYLCKLRKKPTGEKPFLFSMTKGKKIFMIIYSVIMNAFFILVFCYIIPLFIYQFIDTFPGLAKELIHQISSGSAPSFQLIKRIFSQMIIMGFMTFAIYKILKPKIVILITRITNNGK